MPPRVGGKPQEFRRVLGQGFGGEAGLHRLVDEAETILGQPLQQARAAPVGRHQFQGAIDGLGPIHLQGDGRPGSRVAGVQLADETANDVDGANPAQVAPSAVSAAIAAPPRKCMILSGATFIPPLLFYADSLCVPG